MTLQCMHGAKTIGSSVKMPELSAEPSYRIRKIWEALMIWSADNKSNLDHGFTLDPV